MLAVVLSPINGKVILSNDEHPENASSPIDVTLSGIFILVSPLQPENAYQPIDVTLSGIVILVSPLQLWKALPPIPVTSLPLYADFITISVLSQFNPITI